MSSKGSKQSDKKPAADQQSGGRRGSSKSATKSSMKGYVTLKAVQMTHNAWVDRFVRETGIERNMISNIYNFCKLLPRLGCDTIDKNVFTAQLFKTFGLSDHVIIDRIFQVSKAKVKDIDMNVEDFTRLICTFVTEDIRTKAKFVYSVYNNNIKEPMGTRDIYYKLKQVVAYTMAENSEDVEEESLKDMVDLTVQFFDEDRDGIITYSEFEQSCIKTPLLLECLGPCLPKPEYLFEFKTKMTMMTELETLAHYRQERRRCLGYPSMKVANPVQQWYPIQLDLPGNI